LYLPILPLLLLSASSCANVVPPTGGEPNKTPLRVLATVPEQRALNARPSYISLEFNNYIQQRAQLYQSIFLTPSVKTEYSWAGKTLFIAFQEPLDSSATVALTLGTQFSDWDNNKPESAFTLIFSTGDKLDSGTIRAKVEAEKPEGLMAFLYPLGEENAPDTLNPGTTKPKYKTQVGSNKTIEFPALSKGRYRLFLLRDEYRNDLLDVGVDAFGMLTGDIRLEEGGTEEVLIRLAPVEDRLPPSILEVRPVSPRRLVVRMSEKIHPASLNLSAVGVADSARFADSISLGGVRTDSAAEPRILYAHLDVQNPALLHCYADRSLVRSGANAEKPWRFSLGAVRDSAGNVVTDEGGVFYFRFSQESSAASLADTALPALARAVVLNAPSLSPFSLPELADSAQGVPLAPRIGLVFTAPITLATVNAGGAGFEILWEESGNPPRTILARAETENGNVLALQATAPAALSPNAWYSIGLRLRDIAAWHGAPLRDSIVVIHFQTDNPKEYGGVSGVLRDTRAEKTEQRPSIAYFLTLEEVSAAQATAAPANSPSTTPQGSLLQNVAQKSQQRPDARKQSSAPNSFAQKRFEIKLSEAGAWEFRNVPPGTYRLSVFADANGNGRYDFGVPHPFAPAERLLISPNEINVRPRWTVENVEIILP
jgi:hypothetical protein